MTQHILHRRDGAVAWIALNRPDKHNALTAAMWDRLATLMAELSADDSARCVVIAGAGGKAFSAGADIAEFESLRANSGQAKTYGRRMHRCLGAIAAGRHPVIASISGLCVGGGLELAAACDLRICGTGARFGIPVNLLGLVVAYAELRPLLRLVGPARAKEMLFEGRLYDAAAAERMGLVNRIVADDAVEQEALAAAERIAEGAPLVARWHKRFVDRLLDPAPLAPAEDDDSYRCFDTEDFRIGRAAFLAKKKPKFLGR